MQYKVFNDMFSMYMLLIRRQLPRQERVTLLNLCSFYLPYGLIVTVIFIVTFRELASQTMVILLVLCDTNSHIN